MNKLRSQKYLIINIVKTYKNSNSIAQLLLNIKVPYADDSKTTKTTFKNKKIKTNWINRCFIIFFKESTMVFFFKLIIDDSKYIKHRIFK